VEKNPIASTQYVRIANLLAADTLDLHTQIDTSVRQLSYLVVISCRHIIISSSSSQHCT
jgi:hypothetical protein